jgi:hypothetical protein
MGFYRGPNIVTDGLVFAVDPGSERSYPGTGTTASSLMTAYDGTLINGTGFSTDNGGTWELDGVNDRISFDGATILGYLGVTSGIDNNVAYSMEAWIKIDAYPSGIGTSGDTIMGHRDSLGIGLQVFGTTTTAYINFGYRTNSNYDSGNITINEWHHIVGTRAVGGAIVIYIDGVADLTVNGNNAIDYTTNSFEIGYAVDRIGPFNGDISSTRIYNKSLTAAEVLQNFNAQKSRFGL